MLFVQDDSPCARFMTTLETHFHHLLKAVPNHITESTFLVTLTAECCRVTDQAQSSIPPTSSILKALLQVQFNSIAVVPQQHTAASDRIAVAMYPTASLMNHSCIPNVALAFDGASLTARPTETLQPGTPVLHCYGIL